MRKILVTGATGFVGYHVARKLVEKNWGEVHCLVRPRSERKFLNALPVKQVEGDMTDPSSLEKAFNGCEIVFHVAADYRLWSRDPEDIIRANVSGTENILRAAKICGVPKIVYTSSVSAVGRPEPGVHPKAPYPSALNPSYQHVREIWEKKWEGNESMDPTVHQQIGPYKQSKFQAELVARWHAKEGVPVVIVNPSTPIGTHDIKPTPTGKMIVDFLNGKMPAYLETGLNLIDVDDVAEGHLLAAEKGKTGERYILGNKNLMLKEILDLLSQSAGRPAPRFKIPYAVAYAAGFVSTSVAQITGKPPEIPLDAVRMASEIMFYDSSKAVAELGLPQNSLPAALEKSVRFFKDNGYVKA